MVANSGVLCCVVTITIEMCFGVQIVLQIEAANSVVLTITIAMCGGIIAIAAQIALRIAMQIVMQIVLQTAMQIVVANSGVLC